MIDQVVLVNARLGHSRPEHDGAPADGLLVLRRALSL